MRRCELSYLWFLTALVLFCGACGSDFEDETFKNGRTIREWVEYDRRLPEEDAPPPLDDLVLYLDSSLSMQGYSDPDGAFEYSRALRAVRSVVDKLNPRHKILFRRVAEDVGALTVSEETLYRASRDPGFYDGGETNLGGAIRSFDQPEPTLREGTGIARCHIMITDGVQHLNYKTVDPDCGGGSDPRCVNIAVRRLIDKGWGVHLIGVRSRFNGPIYSEIRRGWLGQRYTATSTSQPERFRPFLIYLFTNHDDFMDQLAQKFRSELIDAGIGEELIVELPLTLPLIKTSRLELATDHYRLFDQFGEEIENPLHHRAESMWREDFDGELLLDEVEVLEYSYSEVDFTEPFAVHVSAWVDFTDTGQILFSRATADAGSMLEPLTVSEVPRPPHWYRQEEETEDPDEETEDHVQGTGKVSDREGVEEEEDSDAASEDHVDERPTWPPAGVVVKKLNFRETLLSEVPTPPFVVPEEEPQCSLPGGCNLVLKWSRQAAEHVPITLLKVEGSFDPERLRLPSWLDEWTTEDDSQIRNGNKILNLNLLTHNLLDNEHIAEQGIEPWYLLIYPVRE